MKKIILTFFSLAFICTMSFAQGAEGCDGSRYLAGTLFEEVALSTVTYGENIGVDGVNQELQMDIYEPVGDMNSQRPAIVLAHGGSYVFGVREDLAALATQYAQMGYVAVSITYRLYPLASGWPNEANMVDVVVKSVGDMKAAVRYLKMDAATSNTYKVDPDYILVGGISAGAITAMHVGHLGEDDTVPADVQLAIDNNGGLDGTSGNPDYDSDVVAVVNLSGGLHDKNWIDADDTPFISMHGDNDATVPYDNGLAASIVYIDGSGSCSPAADLAGVDNYLVTVPGGGHVNIYTDEQFDPYLVDFTINGNLFLHNILCPNTLYNTNELLDNEVTVYPNPAINELTIDLGTIESNYDLVVYNQVGQVVHNVYNLTDSQVTLNKADFGAGFFVVEIRLFDDGIQSITRKVIFE